MPTNFFAALIGLFRTRGIIVEMYLGGSDQALVTALQTAGYPGTAACASLAYEWIAQQLLQGFVAGPDNPMFGNQRYGGAERQRVADRQMMHALGLKAMQENAKLIKQGVIDASELDTIKTYPYEALINRDALMVRLTSDGQFGPWAPTGASDHNIARMIADLGRLAQESAASEAQVKSAMISIPKKIGSEEGLTLQDYKNSATYWTANFDRIANQSPDYFAILVVRSSAFGHAFGIRYQPHNNQVHFFDPNVGHFRFQGWKDATDNIQAYWRATWQVDVYRDKSATDKSQPAKTEAYPPDHSFKTWAVYQFRKRALDKDFDDFLW